MRASDPRTPRTVPKGSEVALSADGGSGEKSVTRPIPFRRAQTGRAYVRNRRGHNIAA